MSFRTTLSLLIVLVLVGAGVWWFQYGPGRSGPELPKVVESDPLAINRIEIVQKDKKIVYQKSFLKIWEMQEPRYNVVDSRQLEVATVMLSALQARQELKSPGPTLAEYGLEPAEFTVKVDFASGTSLALLFGYKTPDGSAYYVKKEDATSVYLVPDFVADPVLNLFRSPPVTPTPTPTRTETPWPPHLPTHTVTPTWTPWPTLTPTPWTPPTFTPTGTNTPVPRTPSPIVLGTSTPTPERR